MLAYASQFRITLHRTEIDQTCNIMYIMLYNFDGP